jgi:VIT1/CCC1 family predicted Fe2+/Mn2+ transporter
MPDEAPQVPQPGDLPAPEVAPEAAQAKTEPAAPTSGRRAAFRDIRRQLTEEELRQTGVQKVLIEDFERAEIECEALKVYVERYHEKNVEVARLTEKLRSNVAMEIITGVGLAGGGAIISLSSLFFADPKDSTKGVVAIGVGFLFLIGSTVAKIVQVKR